MVLHSMDEFKGQQFYRPLTRTEIRLMTIRHPTIERIGEEYYQAIPISADCNTESENIKSMFNRIECQLEYALLEDGPEFAALSYVWGDPNDTVEIILNGKEFSVT